MSAENIPRYSRTCSRCKHCLVILREPRDGALCRKFPEKKWSALWGWIDRGYGDCYTLNSSGQCLGFEEGEATIQPSRISPPRQWKFWRKPHENEGSPASDQSTS